MGRGERERERERVRVREREWVCERGRERVRERETTFYLDLQYQDMQKLLGANTVAYLNVDVAVSGEHTV